MPKINNQKGVVHLLLPILLLLGIVAGVYLITQGNPLKLFSKASNPPIVFKKVDGSSLPTNSSGIAQTTSATVRVELTSTLGSPVSGNSVSAPSYSTPTGGYSYPTPSSYTTPSYATPSYGTPSYNTPSYSTPSTGIIKTVHAAYSTPAIGGVSEPIKPGTVSYRIAENPTDLSNTSYVSYTQEPTVITYTFKDANLGQKFLWAEFKAADGTTDRRSAQIDLVSASGGSSSGFGKAIKFNNETSNNAYLVIRPTFFTNLAMPSEWTLDGWIKTPKPVSGNYLRDYSVITLTKPQGFYDNGYLFRLNLETQESNGESRPMFKALLANWTDNQNRHLAYISVGAQSAVRLKADTWNHIAITSTTSGNKCTLKMYIDGKLAESTERIMNPTCTLSAQQPQEVWFAKPPTSLGGISGYYYPGLIDDARLTRGLLYSSEFSPGSINPNIVDRTNTIALYQFNGNINDDSTYRHNTQSFGNIQFVDSTIGAPVPTPSPVISTPPIGFIEELYNVLPSISGLIGWAYDPDESSKAVSIEAYLDKEYAGQSPAATGVTNILRSDVNSARKITGSHGFNLPIAGLNDGKAHKIYVYALDTQSGNRVALTRSPYDTSKIVPNPKSNFETITSDGYVVGWALDPTNPTSQLTIKLYIDTVNDPSVGSGVTDQLRADVNKSLSVTGNHGFKVKIPSKYRDGKSHSIYVFTLPVKTGTSYISGSRYMITNSPKTFTLK